jgi:uncharacterized RDD family membrane protein YckC
VPPGPVIHGPLGYPPPGYRPPAGWPPGPLSPSGYPLASFGDRLLAFLIDVVVLSIISVVVYVPLVIGYRAMVIGLLPANTPARDVPVDRAFVAILLPFVAFGAAFLLIHYLYTVELMFRSGQTVGKWVMRIRVIALDPRLPLTRRMAAKRFLILSVADSIVPLLFFLDGFWQLADQPFRQCLHDKFAETVVIKLNW